MSDNPLKQYIRPIKITVKLPSGGIFNKEKINLSVNDELSVCGMTARDELLLKNPDALLNGEAIEGLIKSCAPDIQNVRETPNIDIDLILLAIQYATYGDKLEFDATCTNQECKHPNHFKRSIRAIIDSMQPLPNLNKVKVAENIELVLKPYTFADSTRANILDFESQKKLTYVQSLYESIEPSQLAEVEKITKQQMTEVFNSMADMELEVISNSIIQVNLLEKNEKNEITIVPITDRTHIKEYIWALDPNSHSIIKEKMTEMAKFGINKTTKLTCEKCNHEWESEVGFNQANFFGSSSQRQQVKI